MKSFNYKQQKGFTLVEIAIVLVIIGLLLGGILKGQQLINSARVRNMADQNSSVQAAYYGFIDRYRAVPGDMLPLSACNAIGANQLGVAAGCGTPPPGGNGNGRLDTGLFTEAAAVWRHLTAANFLVGDYSGVAADSTAYTAAATPHAAPSNAFGARILLGRTDQYLAVVSATERLGFITGRNAPVSILAELDTKVDDGRPATGVFRSTLSGSTSYGAVAQNDALCTTGTGNAALWNVNVETQDCNAIYLY